MIEPKRHCRKLKNLSLQVITFGGVTGVILVVYFGIMIVTQ